MLLSYSNRSCLNKPDIFAFDEKYARILLPRFFFHEGNDVHFFTWTIPFWVSTVTCMPSFKTFVAIFVPTMQGMPSSLETIAAWLVIPPVSVMMAFAFRMAMMKSGEVMGAT